MELGNQTTSRNNHNPHKIHTWLWVSWHLHSIPSCDSSKQAFEPSSGAFTPFFQTQVLGGVLRRRQWHPAPVLLPGKSHGQRRLVGWSPWGCKESDMTERLHFHFSLSCIGEGNGNPLQCPCLENPRDMGAWWAAVYGVTQSWTRLKRLSSSSSRGCLLPLEISSINMKGLIQGKLVLNSAFIFGGNIIKFLGLAL